MEGAQLTDVPSGIRERSDVWTPGVLMILCAAFITSVSTYMAQPFFVIYYHRALGFSAVQAGVLIGVTPLCGALFGVLGGFLSDRLGIRPAYSVAVLISGLCMAGFAVFHAYAVLMVISVVMGLAMSTTRSGAQALLNVRMPADKAGSAQTVLYWLNNLAIVIGPPVAALLLGAGTKPTVFVLAGGLMTCLSLVILLFLRNPRHPLDASASTPTAESKDSSERTGRPSFVSAMRLVGTDPVLLWTFIALLCYIVIEAQLTSTVPLYVTSKFAHGTQYYGFMNTEVAVVALGLTPVAARLTKNVSVMRVIGTGVAVLGIGLAVAGFSGQAVGWLVGILLYGVGEVVAMPKINEIMAGTVGRQQPATYFAAINSALFLGMFAGYTFGAPLYAAFSSKVLYTGVFGVALISIYAFSKANRGIQLRRAVDNARIPDEVLAQIAEQAPAD